VPIVIQVSIAVAALAIVGIAVALIRVLTQMRATAAQLERTMLKVEESIPTIMRTVEETRDVLDSFSHVAERVDRITGQFEVVGGKAARLSNMVVTEVLEPVGQVAAIVRGVRAGTSVFVNGLFNRRTRSNAGTGGNHNE